ncbi:MAG: hypothetical protein N2C14_23725 [Planctomycetales bacterium]
MSRLEILDGTTLDDFLQSPRAVLMLGKSDCAACKKWTGELETFLATEEEWSGVRFGKLELDQRGITSVKRANPWLAELDDLPYNVIYFDGERKKSWLGSGVERLVNRLRKLISS